MTVPSLELPVDSPASAEKFDTTTPAYPTQIRRFSLNDLPRFGNKIYPILKNLFPHLNERMYAGWLRNTINDNASFFVCAEKSVALAQISYDPMNPIPYIQVVFVIGNSYQLYDEIVSWAKNTGAREVRVWANDKELIKVKGQCGEPEKRICTVLHLLPQE